MTDPLIEKISNAGVEPRVSAFTSIEAEGARVGVTSCRVCGAAILLDPRDDFDNIAIHLAWHDAP